MRLLVVHAWLTGNLGDVMQTRVLLEALRDLGPARLDLAGHPAKPAASWDPLLRLVDGFQGEETTLRGPRWARRGHLRLVGFQRRKAQRARLFARYDAVVSAPGPFLASYDARADAALADLAAARAAGVPFVFSSHSIGPLRRGDLRRLSGAALVVAREEATHAYLAAAGVPSHLAADYAFLYPDAGAEEHRRAFGARFGEGYRLAILRFNNLGAASLEVRGGALVAGGNVLLPAGPGALVLGTSDPVRDDRHLAALGSRLGLPVASCRSPEELLGLIAGARVVASDRYHPCLRAGVAGREVAVLGCREAHKMDGLRELLRTRPVEDLRASAAGGLARVAAVLKGRVGRASLTPERAP